MNADRKTAIEGILAREDKENIPLKPFTTENFGEDVFHCGRMKERLPKPIYQKQIGRASCRERVFRAV